MNVRPQPHTVYRPVSPAGTTRSSVDVGGSVLALFGFFLSWLGEDPQKDQYRK